MRRSLAGRRLLITGPARGIGECTARLAAARGARVALVGLEGHRLAALADELGPGHHWAECDVTDQESLDAAAAAAVAAFGGLDVVVANAGVVTIAPVATASLAALTRTVEVNLTGVIRTVHTTLPHLIDARGYVLLISSAAAFTAMPGMAAYAASKAAMEQFGNVLRVETAHLGVRVGLAHPVWIHTDMLRGYAAHPAFDAARRRLPWPLDTVTSADDCAQALVRGIERRKRRIYVPRSLALVQALRPLVLSRVGDRITAAITGAGDLVTRLAEENRSDAR
jgi:short-subunit dehydrogenase